MGMGRMRMGRPMSDEEKQEKPQLTAAFLKRIFSWLLPFAPQMILVLICILAAALLDLQPALLSGRIIDEGFIDGNFNLLVILVAASFGVTIASNLISILQSWLSNYVAFNIQKNMRNQMFRHLQEMAYRFFSESKPGDIITRMTSDIDGIGNVIEGSLTSLLSNSAVLVTSLFAMYQKNWILATVGMLILPLFILPTRAVSKKRWELTAQVQEKRDEGNQILNESLSVSGQLLTKLFTNEDVISARFAVNNEDTVKLRIRESLAGRWFRMTITVLTSMGPMFIYLVGGLLMMKYGNTDLTVGDITVMVALLTRLYRPVNSLLGIQVELVRAGVLFSRIFNYLDLPVEIKNAPDAMTPDAMQGHIVFDNVRFGYSRDKEVLHGVSFDAPSGSTVAIVGPSGSGKTSITNLIDRLYDSTGGLITIDGIDIRKLDLKFLRANVGIVTQESYLFNGTIRENLLFAKADATLPEMESACESAHILELINSLPKGFDTVVGNRGVKLSGGEKQRLAIARIILKNPRIVIFDEATSSLDSISENLIQKAMGPLLSNRTGIVIAHRLSTIVSSDKILVVKDGLIVEQGTHTELLEDAGVYADLFAMQFEAAFADQNQQTP